MKKLKKDHLETRDPKKSDKILLYRDPNLEFDLEELTDEEKHQYQFFSPIHHRELYPYDSDSTHKRPVHYLGTFSSWEEGCSYSCEEGFEDYLFWGLDIEIREPAGSNRPKFGDIKNGFSLYHSIEPNPISIISGYQSVVAAPYRWVVGKDKIWQIVEENRGLKETFGKLVEDFLQ